MPRGRPLCRVSPCLPSLPTQGWAEQQLQAQGKQWQCGRGKVKENSRCNSSFQRSVNRSGLFRDEAHTEVPAGSLPDSICLQRGQPALHVPTHTCIQGFYLSLPTFRLPLVFPVQIWALYKRMILQWFLAPHPTPVPRGNSGGSRAA